MTSGKAGEWLVTRSKRSLESIASGNQAVIECCFLKAYVIDLNFCKRSTVRLNLPHEKR
jgi:hypothetical protein